MKTNPLNNFLNSIIPQDSKIIFPSQILLCGGPISSPKYRFKSARDFFYQFLKSSESSLHSEIILVEKTMDYFFESDYEDLLTFEKDLASLSALIIVFAESPGSIAELGSFASLEGIKEKLLVVIKEEYSGGKSFIMAGPVEHVRSISKDHDSDIVFVYDWQVEKGCTAFIHDYKEHAINLEESIQKIIASLPHTKKFSLNNTGHVMLLISEFINILQIVKISDIYELIDVIVERMHRAMSSSEDSMKKPARHEIDKYVDLLVNFKFFEKIKYGNSSYYLSIDRPTRFEFEFKRGATLTDLHRWKSDFRNFYKEKEPLKSKVLASFIKKQIQAEKEYAK